MLLQSAALTSPGMDIDEQSEYYADSGSSTSGEHRLWCAVILASLNEYEGWLRRIEAVWQQRYPVKIIYKWQLEEIRRHVVHPYFVDICELVCVPHSTVLKRMGEMEREYCLGAVPFIDEDAAVDGN